MSNQRKNAKNYPKALLYCSWPSAKQLKTKKQNGLIAQYYVIKENTEHFINESKAEMKLLHFTLNLSTQIR